MIAGFPEHEYIASGHRACAGCLQLTAFRIALKASGSNTILVQATGCGEVTTTPYPETAWKIPYIHGAFENAAAIASGIDAALKSMRRKHNMLVFAGDGGTFDIGMQALSSAIERGHKFCYICFDNGAYSNTGVQRSGATPMFASTTTTPAGRKIHGKTQWKKNMPMIVATHNQGIYCATANIAYVQDFYQKVKKGLENNASSYIQVLVPCVPGWGYPPEKGIELARLAFMTKISPLFEVENSMLRFTKKPSNFLPVDAFLMQQARFKHLSRKEIAVVQKRVDNEYEKLLKLEESKIRI